MTTTINAQINYFGPLIKNKDVNRFLKQPGTMEHEVNLLESLLDVPHSEITRERLLSYIEVSPRELFMIAAPYTPKLEAKLLKPLKASKKLYCLGEHLAAIALAGVVAEMMAHLIWYLNEATIKGKKMSGNTEEELFGSKFDQLTQNRRIKILSALTFITPRQRELFDQIRTARNPYIHSWKKNLTDKQEKDDAGKAVLNAFRLFQDVTGMGELAAPGVLKINPLIKKLFRDGGTTSSPSKG